MDVALHLGYEQIGSHAMDTYPRYDVHRKNSIRTERLVMLKAPQR